MQALPFIDELVVPTREPAERIWAGLISVLPRTSIGGRVLARLLRCEPVARTATFSAKPGDTIPGFRVQGVESDRRLLLAGQHRFSRYRLEFLVDDGQLRARTHAAFPGLRGRLYRAAVVGTGAHQVVTRNLLRRIARAT